MTRCPATHSVPRLPATASWTKSECAVVRARRPSSPLPRPVQSSPVRRPSAHHGHAVVVAALVLVPFTPRRPSTLPQTPSPWTTPPSSAVLPHSPTTWACPRTPLPAASTQTPCTALYVVGRVVPLDPALPRAPLTNPSPAHRSPWTPTSSPAPTMPSPSQTACKQATARPIPPWPRRPCPPAAWTVASAT